MARTAKMQFIELLVMKDDISRVIEYLGKQGCFAFQSDSVAQSLNKVHSSAPIDAMHQLDSGFGEEFDHLVEAKEIFQRLQEARAYLNIPEPAGLTASTGLPSERDYRDTRKMISVTEQFKREESELEQAHKRMESAYREALAFSNLQVPYSELDQVSFLSIRIGRVDPERLENLKFAVGEHGAIVALGEDKSRIIAVSSKKGRFSLDTELKKAGFVPIEIAKDFQGIPAEALDRLRQQTAKAQEAFEQVTAARRKFAETHGFIFQHLLCNFSVATQVLAVQENLESTMLVYRITGWVPERDATATVREIDDLAEGRVAIRLYKPDEVPGVQEGVEQVPVKLNHGEFVGSFERMILSYGTPRYGTIDPMPLVAIFFTLLFGIMFGDVGQGLVFVGIGILLRRGVIKKFAAWQKFAPIFVGIGCSSTVMGFLNGEFFSNHHVLDFIGSAVAGLFGTTYPFLHLMPNSDSIHRVFYFFIFTLGIGFIINSTGLVVNIINQVSLKHLGKALFGKTGLSGALFFWYVIALAVRIAVWKYAVSPADWAVMGLCLGGVFLGEPLERLVEGERPVFEDGLGVAAIHGVVEVLEIISSYFSNSLSFLRVGAFALAHAVLGFIIFTMTDLIGGAASPSGILVTVAGNAVVILLEGMIVAIQVIRLQYYEFFSKFFTETGKEFIPFRFTYRP